MIASDSTPNPLTPLRQVLISINAHFMTAQVYDHVGFIYFSLHYAKCGAELQNSTG